MLMTMSTNILNHLDDFDAVLKPIEEFLEAIEKLFSDKTRR